MNYLLNIGMDRNDGEANTDGLLMLSLLNAGLLHEGEVAYVQSDTERTAVLQYEQEPTTFQLEYLCELLGQEAIALYSEKANTGVLVGPKAEEWGPFDASMFFTSTGKRLSDVLPRAVPPFTLGVICDMPEGDQ